MDLVTSPQRKPLSDEEFIAAWAAGGGSPVSVARITGIAERNVYERRNRLRAQGVDLPTQSLNPAYARRPWTYPREIALTLPPGSTILVGGDGHAWPGEIPPIWHAFVAVARQIKPTVLVLNGDMIDGTRVSDHPRMRFQNAPRVADEIKAFQSWVQMLPKAQYQCWNLGNHDIRVDKYLANKAPEMDEFAGRLQDFFPGWQFGWATAINDMLEIRHRFRGGIHAAYNNALNAGWSCISSHTHQLICTPVVDRRGTRWGVEVGMLNDPLADTFEYAEGMPSRQRSGFALLTVGADGALQPPELCEWVNGCPMFRAARVDWKPRSRVRAGSGSIA